MAKHTRRVLIVDDNADDLDYYSTLLKRVKGDYLYEVFTASDVETALLIFAREDITCTLVDYYMPQNDGLEIAAMLQKTTGNKAAPLIILTGEPQQKIQAEAARQGAMDYVAKNTITSPDGIEKLINKVVTWTKALE